MPLGSVICRKKLGEERGNDFLCECPIDDLFGAVPICRRRLDRGSP